jgi:antiviral helicase SKI2
MLGQQSIASKARRRRTEGNESPELQVSRLGDDQEVGGSNGAGPSKKNVDDLLPIGVSYRSRSDGPRADL